MRRHHDKHAAAWRFAPLDHAFDRHIGVAHSRRQLGEHARAIGNGKAQIGPADAVACIGAPLRRKVQFMAKSQMFARPLQWVYTHGGVFPVQRGRRDEESMITARSILERGGCMAMYCEGGRSRSGDLAERAKPGIGRIALETGATIVPVAIHGSARVRNWKRLEFPKITVQYGEPFRYERTEVSARAQQQAVADEIFTAIRELYQGLESYGRSGVIARIRAERRLARRSGKRHMPAT